MTVSGSRVKDAIAVARDMIERHGPHAISVVDQRFQDNLTAGDAEAAAFWSQVARAVRVLLAGGGAAGL